MSIDSAHKSKWEIAEVVFGLPFLVGMALHFFVPISLTQGIFRQVIFLFGIVLIIIGIGLIILTRREFARYGQPTDPGYATSRIIQTGLFAWSRNPLYLATAILLLGLALTLNSVWVVLMLSPSLILCHYVLINPEEKYLEAKFGKQYEEYKVNVHRWFGRKESVPRMK